MSASTSAPVRFWLWPNIALSYPPLAQNKSDAAKAAPLIYSDVITPSGRRDAIVPVAVQFGWIGPVPASVRPRRDWHDMRCAHRNDSAECDSADEGGAVVRPRYPWPIAAHHNGAVDNYRFAHRRRWRTDGGLFHRGPLHRGATAVFHGGGLGRRLLDHSRQISRARCFRRRRDGVTDQTCRQDRGKSDRQNSLVHSCRSPCPSVREDSFLRPYPTRNFAVRHAR